MNERKDHRKQPVVFFLYSVDRFQFDWKFQMGVNLFCDTLTFMTYDLLDHTIINTCCGQQTDTGVSGIMGSMIQTKDVHHRCPVTVIVISVCEVLPFWGADQPFRIFPDPMFHEGNDLFSNRDFPDP